MEGYTFIKNRWGGEGGYYVRNEDAEKYMKKDIEETNKELEVSSITYSEPVQFGYNWGDGPLVFGPNLQIKPWEFPKYPSIDITLNHPDAKVPKKEDNDAGYDLISVEDAVAGPGMRCKVNTGISIRLPQGWVGLIWPRSGLAVKQGVDILAGVIDSHYNGDIIVCLYNTSFDSIHIPKGSKIAQYIIQEYKTVNFVVKDKLDDSQRGEKGFGSSDI